jgi:hypothetical protein
MFLSLAGLLMNVVMASGAEGNHIFGGIIPERAAETEMVNLQLACMTAILALPAIAI